MFSRNNKQELILKIEKNEERMVSTKIKTVNLGQNKAHYRGIRAI